MILLLGLLTTAWACDGAAAWDRLLTLLDDGASPELPLADLVALDEARGQIDACPAAPWHPEVAANALHLLRGRPERVLGASPAPCAHDATCVALDTVVRWVARQDAVSSLGHARLSAVIMERDPSWLLDSQTDTEALIAALRAPEPVRRLAMTWYGSGALRDARGALSALQFGPSRSRAATQFARLAPEGADPALRWTVDPLSPPPADTPTTRLLAALAAVSPDAPLTEAGEPWAFPPADAPMWATRGQLSPKLSDLTPRPSVLAEALSPRSRGEVLRRMGLALHHLRAGEIAAAIEVLRAAEALALELDIGDLQVSVALLGVDLGLRQDDPHGAVAALDRALAVVDVGPGRQHAALRVAAALAVRHHVTADRFVAADLLLGAVVDRAESVGATSALADVAGISVQLADQLDLLPEALARTTRALAALDAADTMRERQRANLLDRISPAWIDLVVSPTHIAGRRLLVLQARADLLARLGAPLVDVRAVLDEAARTGELAASMPANPVEVMRGQAPRPLGNPFTPEVYDETFAGAQIARYRALGDQAGLRAQVLAGGSSEYSAILAAAEGDVAGLTVLHHYAEALQAFILSSPLGHDAIALARQDLAGKREQLLLLGPRATPWAPAAQVLEAWRADPLTASLVTRWPWTERIQTGMAAAALAEPEVARAAFDEALQLLRAQTRPGPTRHRNAELDAWSGAIQTRLDEDPERALWLLDELRERELRRRVGLAPEPVAPPAQVPRTTLVLAQVGWRRTYAMWTLAPGRAPTLLRVEVGVDEPDLHAAVRNAAHDGLVSPSLQRLLDGLDLQAGEPLLLVSDLSLRAAGLHLLPVGGRPLALDHPLSWAPTVGLGVAAFAVQAASGERVAIGRAVASAEGADLAALTDRRELRAPRPDRTLWEEEATRAAVGNALAGASLVHLSTHGWLDRLRPDRTGLVLADGVLTLGDLRDTVRPGMTVVLSACGSGATAAYGSAPLDLGVLLGGARTVVATPMPDVNAKEAAAWMTQFYRHLQAGDPPSVAAWKAYRARATGGRPAWAWGAFLVVGAG